MKVTIELSNLFKSLLKKEDLCFEVGCVTASLDNNWALISYEDNMTEDLSIISDLTDCTAEYPNKNAVRYTNNKGKFSCWRITIPRELLKGLTDKPIKIGEYE